MDNRPVTATALVKIAEMTRSESKAWNHRHTEKAGLTVSKAIATLACTFADALLEII